MLPRSFVQARALALGVPALLLAGALGSQYFGGLIPCEMCVWQRWPHLAALMLGVLAFVKPSRILVALAAMAIMTSGAIGVFHAGVEYRWWQGLTTCSVPSVGEGDFLGNILAAPLVRCDQIQWSLFGISLAGWNALASLGLGGLILWLTTRRR